MTCSVAIMWSRLPWAAGLEHLQHAVGDNEAAHNIARRRDDCYRSQYRGQLAFPLARQDDCADHRNGVQCIRQRHQRRVQQRRNAPDHFESYECGQHEHVEARKQIQLHEELLPADVDSSAGSEKNSRTRAFTTSPSFVSMVSRMMSSCRFICSLPSFVRCCRNALMFRANNWLAW